MSSPVSNDGAEQLAALGNALRVVFYRRADRIAHRVEHAASGRVILASVEGTDSDEWPPSPPLQELHLSPTASAASAALLVGMAGRSHWSMSAQAPPEPVGVSFELACRLQARPIWLGSQYHIAPGTHAELEAGSVLLSRPGERWQARLSGSDCQWKIVAQTIAIEANAPLAALPTTARWSYRLELATR